jgi:hypothetical protein
MGRNPEFRIMGSNPLPSASLAEGMRSLRELLAIKPSASGDSHLNSKLLTGRAGLFFSEWPISLRSSGLCGFVRFSKFQCFEKLNNCSELGFCSSSRTGNSVRFRIRHIEVRISTGDSGMFCAQTLHFKAFASESAASPVSENWQPWREFVESLRPEPRKFPFLRRLAETGSITTGR